MIQFKKISFFKKLANYFMNYTIGTKMLIAYVIVILIPTGFYSVYFYVQISNNILNMYMTSNQQVMEQSYSNLKEEISRIESMYQLFQYNNSLTDFLSGYYTDHSEEVYAYLKDIQPLFTYSRSSNSHILEDITIYKYRKSLVNYQHYIINADLFPGDQDIARKITPDKGLWVFSLKDDKDSIKYYKKFYNKNFYRELGFIQITIKSKELFDILNFVDDKKELLFKHDNEWFTIKNGEISKIGIDSSNPIIQHFFASGLSAAEGKYSSSSKLLVNSLKIKELNVDVILLTPITNVMGNSKDYIPLVYLAVLLVILSLIYYVIISSVTNRMAKLAKYIRKTDHDNLVEYKDADYKDEIGAVIKEYNEMIVRIGSLINSVNLAKLKKKEADFYMMQAQIKPHFIYNSLETIRMMAEANEDPSVADITYSLGRFMRYNLSRKKDETLLKDEVENVRNYLQIYKVSMGERLEYSIEVNCDIDSIKCPGFILQPLVENSLHHGLSNHRGRCNIEVNINKEHDFIIVTVADNGAGIPAERLKTIRDILAGSIDPSELKQNGNGIGIVNVNERIKAYFGELSGLFIDSQIDSGTTSRIKFQYHGRSLDNASDGSR